MAWYLTMVVIFCITGTLTDAECHCNTAAACAVFPSTPCSQVGDPDRCQEGWFGSYCQKQNIALGRNATQSSTFMENSDKTGHRTHYFEARYAVDGRATTKFYSKPLTCTHALAGVQTWTVDLDNPNTDKIQHIRLYLREGFLERKKGMKINVDGQLCFQWSTDTYPLAVADVKCQQALTGHTVTIQANTFLALCEVQIFVCSDGWFGEDCGRQCHCSLNTEVCDKITGQCPSGCAPGYRGTDCHTACQDGYYGDCSSKCGNCLNAVPCDKATGICPDGCAAGWQTDTCRQPCQDGYYWDCSSKCGNCLNAAPCNKATGICPGGCAAGWQTDICLQPCQDGYYGDCSSKCGNCLNAAPCNKATGICPGGCAAGWQTDTCLQRCQDGYYGDCSAKCGNCLDAALCNKDSGTCPGGCEPGWRTDRCHEPCQDGRYGMNCANHCGNCLDGHACNKSTGMCPRGCAEGWMSDTCLRPCLSGYYGSNCVFHCGNCVNGDVCVKTNGTCPGGCAAGWISDSCKQACRDGYYGTDCMSKCGNCLDNDVCNKSTGTCPKGCAGGWMNNTCDNACPDGYYGTDCTSKCGNCLDNDVCNKSTGTCPKGCAAGWMNNTCDNVCEDGRYGSGCTSKCGHCRSGTVCDKTNGTCGSGCDGAYSGTWCEERLLATEDKDDSMAGIIGGTVAALLAIVIVIIVVVIIFRRRKQPKQLDDERLQSTQDITNLKTRTDKAPRKKPSSTPATKEGENEDAIPSVEAEVDVDNNTVATYYNFVPLHMTLDTLQQCITEKKTKATFQTEFQAIPYGAKHPHEVAMQPENKMKNRFLALYAYDESRVVLADGEDYINANYIYGYGDSQKYIATQGPKPTTVTDFWRMVWQEDVTQIVMLTRLMEMNKKKSAKYWPDVTKTESYGNIQVNNTDVIERADYTISTFMVQSSGVERTVTHYHFTSWPDHGVPSAPALVNFWRLVKQGDMDRGPMVVHCSAGVGRTGAFISLDYLMDEAENDNRVNVYMCVDKMRLNRMNMVQTVSQYAFVHDVVLEALWCRGTLYTLPDFDKTFGLGKSFTAQQQVMLKKEFKLLRELSSNLSKETTSHALLPENSDKNRNLDILPGNDSRPYLCTPVRKRNDYINGVFLHSTLHLSSLIVTQTPLPDTVVDFWRLVCDHDCFTIVCLDDAQETAAMYPEENQELKQGPFSVVQVEADSNRDFCTEKKLTLAHDKENTEESVSLLCLQSLDMLTNTEALLELVSRVDRIISSADHKVLVHCHDGAGASGVFCSVLNIITRLKLDRTVDIFLTIRELQRVRPQFIQTLDQFKLCYDMVKEYNRASNVYANM